MYAQRLAPSEGADRVWAAQELKKNRTERQKTKQAKLSTLDPEEIQEQVRSEPLGAS